MSYWYWFWSEKELTHAGCLPNPYRISAPLQWSTLVPHYYKQIMWSPQTHDALSIASHHSPSYMETAIFGPPHKCLHMQHWNTFRFSWFSSPCHVALCHWTVQLPTVHWIPARAQQPSICFHGNQPEPSEVSCIILGLVTRGRASSLVQIAARSDLFDMSKSV